MKVHPHNVWKLHILVYFSVHISWELVIISTFSVVQFIYFFIQYEKSCLCSLYFPTKKPQYQSNFSPWFQSYQTILNFLDCSLFKGSAHQGSWRLFILRDNHFWENLLTFNLADLFSAVYGVCSAYKTGLQYMASNR